MKVLTNILKPPRGEYELRPIDPIFVENLKKQILVNNVPGNKPLLAVAKGVKTQEDFKAAIIDSYELEVICGNHRRVALAELAAENNDERFQYVDVVLFTGK